MMDFMWHDAANVLPKVSGDYLVCTRPDLGVFVVIPFSVEHQKFNATDGLAPRHALPAAFWAEIPPLPEVAE